MKQTVYDDEVEFGGDDLDDIASDRKLAYCEFLTGSAGTGKTYQIRQRLAENPSYGLLCATTGIAAINLGENTTTVNSALCGYFNTAELIDRYLSGRLVQELARLRNKLGYENLVIDEISMMPAVQLDTIVQAFDDLAKRRSKPMGLILTGDFCQLPPVNRKGEPEQGFAFYSDHWSRFEENTTKLTKNWRQADQAFLEALSQMRQGNGGCATEWLASGNLQYFSNTLIDFPGTTIVATNEEVRRINNVCHQQVQGRLTVSKPKRWGKQKSEWKLIEDELKLKVGAYVMILANASTRVATGEYDEDDKPIYRRELVYANGDCGNVVGIDSATGCLQVELKRSGKTVVVSYVTRAWEQKERPDDIGPDDPAQPYFDEEKKRWVLGTVTYMPLRLAYATTVHKAQGLTLDACQINLSNAFFGQPAMAYVAFSRCRSLEGLRVVGGRELLAKRVCVDPRVMRFL